MRYVGMGLIAIGVLMLLIVGIMIYNENKKSLLSPVPEDKGVKVIFVTPAP